MGTPKVMKLIDPHTNMMQCKVCGGVHMAMLKGGGHFYRGSWQCHYGCKLEEKKKG
jgi:hypothetical protein